MFGFVEKLFKKTEEKPSENALEAAPVSVSSEKAEAEDASLIEEERREKDYPRVFRFDDETQAEKNEKPQKSAGVFSRLRIGLSRSASKLSDSVGSVFSGGGKLDDVSLDELEDMLIEADFGPKTAAEFRDKLSAEKFGKDVSAEEVKSFLSGEIATVLKSAEAPLILRRDAKPNVIMFVGVNGTGKTTTIGKLARQLKDSDLTVYLAAGDTFRAAAVEQLAVWGERNGVPVIKSETGGDAAGLVFDAYKKAEQDGADVLLIDTAGRLQNKTDLMHELLKIRGVLRKFGEDLPHEVLLVLDATAGRNAVIQTEAFLTASGVTGLVVTKLDGTARGGALVGIARDIKLPVYAVGTGEKIEDLQPFSAENFARAVTADA